MHTDPRQLNEVNQIVRELEFPDPYTLQIVAGQKSGNLKFLEQITNVKIGLRGNKLTIKGSTDKVQVVFKTLVQLYKMAEKGFGLTKTDFRKAVEILSTDPTSDIATIFTDVLVIPSASRYIAPKSLGQKRYVEAIRKDPIVFGIGPAGTGKTYLAMAMAVSWLLNKGTKRIVLTRPAVEAGEKLGFLPGDIAEKVNPYLRPLYDALHDMMDLDRARRMVERGEIEIAPLAFMRGRTLNDSFIVLDEAQNTTKEQMKMFLTRLGFNSRAVITGDITQIDLPSGQESGLIHAASILQGIKGISFCFFTEADVVRHPLVAKIIRAYERNNDRHR